MIYPISVLKQEFFQLDVDIQRILKIMNEDKYKSTESKAALEKLYKKQKDLVDAIKALEAMIKTDDLFAKPEDLIKKPGEQ